MARSEQQIISEIADCYCGLSPENLWMDGEASPAEARATEKRLTAKLRALFKELGREIGEIEAYNLTPRGY